MTATTGDHRYLQVARAQAAATTLHAQTPAAVPTATARHG